MDGFLAGPSEDTLTLFPPTQRTPLIHKCRHVGPLSTSSLASFPLQSQALSGTPLALHTEHASSGVQRSVILLEQVARREQEEEYGGTVD